MRYLKYIPSDALTRLIECYYVWEGEVPDGHPLELESPPNGFCSMVFVLGDPYLLKNVKYDYVNVPSQFIAGQSIYSYTLLLSGKLSMAGIVFKPAALATFFNLDMSTFVEERVDLYQIFFAEIIDRVRDDLSKSMTPENKAKVLDDFMLRLHDLFNPEPDFIDDIANEIVSKNGVVKISDLMKRINTSRRTFERKFLQKVGLSPKFFAMIRRISYICNLIAGKQEVEWSRILYHNEFFDQAHFIKNFEAFTGRSPSIYLRENRELARMVPKPSMRNL